LRNLCVDFNQMARKYAKREYRQRPGLRAAAKDLAVSYSHLRRVAIKDRTSVSLMKRLRAWHDNWQSVIDALYRESMICEFRWPVRPWLFVREDRVPLLKEQLNRIANGQPLKFNPKITPLEKVQPWLFSTFNRKSDG